TVAASNPLFGVGIGTYPSAHRLYAAKMGSEFATARGARDAHNTYLLLAAELGVPGLVLFFCLLLSAVIPSFRPAVRVDELDRTALRMIQLGLLAVLLAGVFGSVQYINILYVLLAILCAAPSALSQTPPIPSPSRTGLHRRPLRA
ncbi:MAG: O-antigen ligase family protein, partial [Gemmatimonadaceae bacterium]|nr:O-antigen ligase family protein [Gemmatimonadaceae bacterium]